MKAWIDELREAGLAPTMEQIFTCDKGGEYSIERFFIERARRDGADLLNDGGGWLGNDGHRWYRGDDPVVQRAGQVTSAIACFEDEIRRLVCLALSGYPALMPRQSSCVLEVWGRLRSAMAILEFHLTGATGAVGDPIAPDCEDTAPFAPRVLVDGALHREREWVQTHRDALDAERRLSVGEAARLCGTSRANIYLAISNGKLATLDGTREYGTRKLRIRFGDLQDWRAEIGKPLQAALHEA